MAQTHFFGLLIYPLLLTMLLYKGMEKNKDALGREVDGCTPTCEKSCICLFAVVCTANASVLHMYSFFLHFPNFSLFILPCNCISYYEFLVFSLKRWKEHWEPNYFKQLNGNTLNRICFKFRATKNTFFLPQFSSQKTTQKFFSLSKKLGG